MSKQCLEQYINCWEILLKTTNVNLMCQGKSQGISKTPWKSSSSYFSTCQRDMPTDQTNIAIHSAKPLSWLKVSIGNNGFKWFCSLNVTEVTEYEKQLSISESINQQVKSLPVNMLIEKQASLSHQIDFFSCSTNKE